MLDNIVNIFASVLVTSVIALWVFVMLSWAGTFDKSFENSSNAERSALMAECFKSGGDSFSWSSRPVCVYNRK